MKKQPAESIEQCIVIYGNNRGYAVALFAFNRDTDIVELVGFKDEAAPSNVSVFNAVKGYLKCDDYELRDEMNAELSKLEAPRIIANPLCRADKDSVWAYPTPRPRVFDLAVDRLWDLLAAKNDGRFLVSEAIADKVGKKLARVETEEDLPNHHLAAAMLMMMTHGKVFYGGFDKIG